MTFEHRALNLTATMPLVYTATSKHFFYFRMQISKFVLDQGAVPLNPFMIFEYFLVDTIDRDVVRNANNNLVKRADEIWVFGPVSNGVLAEILQFKETGRAIRYFKIVQSISIEEIKPEAVEFEAEVADQKHLIVA